MIIVKRNICDRCGCCVSVCEADCISVYESRIEIDHEKCVSCKKCVWICPLDALEFSSEKHMVE